MRDRLGTLPPDFIHANSGEVAPPDDPLFKAVTTAFETAELFVGMATGPYLLVLKAEDPARFLQYVRDRPTHDVSIHWSRRDDSGRTWFVVAVDRPNAYRLWFKLPEQLITWILHPTSVCPAGVIGERASFEMRGSGASEAPENAVKSMGDIRPSQQNGTNLLVHQFRSQYE